MKKRNTCNIRRLVDKSFVPSAQWTSVIYCRLTDLLLAHTIKKVFDTQHMYHVMNYKGEFVTNYWALLRDVLVLNLVILQSRANFLLQHANCFSFPRSDKYFHAEESTYSTAAYNMFLCNNIWAKNSLIETDHQNLRLR